MPNSGRPYVSAGSCVAIGEILQSVSYAEQHNKLTTNVPPLPTVDQDIVMRSQHRDCFLFVGMPDTIQTTEKPSEQTCDLLEVILWLSLEQN
jgi:hypothetical protein